VIVHEKAIRSWLGRKDLPYGDDLLLSVLKEIERKKKLTNPENLIIVEESPDTGFKSLPERVGRGNIARLSGARSAYCLRIIREVLEGAGIEVELDKKSSLA
jgi:hypothetical protein